ncbi:calpain-13 [Pogona vitticeps]
MYQKKLGQNSGKIGNVSSSQNFKNQNFTELRDYCLDRGLLFEDSTFPAQISSIGPKVLSEDRLHQIEWLRPIVKQKNPFLIVDGVSRFDICQGQVGDCWVLAALGSVTRQQRFLDRIIPKDQGFKHNYAGIFHFQFWQFGNWVDVVIDDRLPFLNGQYVFVRPSDRNEFWPPLLEKAYAKLRGSYSNLHWGYLSEALVDFTGGVQLDFNLQRPQMFLYEMLKTAAVSGSVMGCTTPGAVQSKVCLFLYYYFQSDLTLLNQKRREAQKVVTILNSPTNVVLENGIVQGHAYTIVWATEVPYRNEKKYIIRLWNPYGDTEWKGAWSDGSMEWDYVPKSYKEKLYENRLDGEFWLNQRTVLNRTGLMRTRDVSKQFKLIPGTYIIIPTMSPEDPESEFLLRIFLKKQNQNTLRGKYAEPSPVMTKDASMWNQDNSYETVFLRYANQSSQLNAFQLQRILNEVVLKDLMASLGNRDGFSFDSSKSLLALMDTNANGSLTLDEFGRLWRDLNRYKDIFRQENERNSGFLDVSDLKRVIEGTGLLVDHKLLRLMIVRYGDPSMRLYFPDFACCMIRLETMAKVFHNLRGDGTEISFTEDQWFTMIMYC